MAASFIDKLKASGKEILETQGAGIEMWKGLKHNKHDLELFLQFNITELKFKPKDEHETKTIVCTSNTRLIAVFQALKEADKKKALRATPFAGIKTRDSSSVLTFNLVDNKYNTISLRAWELGSFVTITEKNLPTLDVLLCDLLKRGENLSKKDDLLFFR